eukprot:TRINITY_DN5725_c0_g3_i1.p1 TRINITY_DN5725_c0_g3~~TRINITY_DN5725_c0_g3_i1.p1  ORF type:complete len:518 (-),score=87.67 TRINITY_DN5725_c0_g3_i1:55-1608(-)
MKPSFLIYLCLLFAVQIMARPPGTLLLNMLTKNEAAHLDRTLPKWAKIIDYWVIGIDEHNTDDSPAIIKKHLGHIPGEIVVVHFEGMGPTWSELVEVGIKNYPQATHGILADADFMPMQDRLDKMQLDIRCSKHMYTIWTQDHRTERKMDWIYRNIPGAVVKRRTHQILEVPALPNQEVFQTLIDLNVEEREGGYGDRTGKKSERYIGFLKADLEDYPGDARTLYYLAYAHLELWLKNQDNPSERDWDNLKTAVDYFIQRSEVEGNKEEKWFAMLKLGEIFERFYKDWSNAKKWYDKCTKDDSERADAWFYLGQHYRLSAEYPTALPYLFKAASLPIPTRSLFQWHYLYRCLSKIELGRAMTALKDNQIKWDEMKETKKLLLQADCSEGDPGNSAEVRSLLGMIDAKLVLSSNKGDPKVVSGKKLMSFVAKNLDTLEDALPSTIFSPLIDLIDKVRVFVDQHKSSSTSPSCRAYRQATTPYLKFIKQHANHIQQHLDDSVLWDKWVQVNFRVRALCP